MSTTAGPTDSYSSFSFVLGPAGRRQVTDLAVVLSFLLVGQIFSFVSQPLQTAVKERIDREVVTLTVNPLVSCYVPFFYLLNVLERNR